MPKYRIFAGLAGGFGGAEEVMVEEFENDIDAEIYAEECAKQEYGEYAGLHGLRDMSQIIEEDGVDEDDAEEIYNEEMLGWIDFWVEEVKDEEADEDDEDNKIKTFEITFLVADSVQIEARDEEEAMEIFRNGHYDAMEVTDVTILEEEDDE